MKKRYLVEFGTGIDLHGEDVTKAAIKAIKDAMSHCCLCGIEELFGERLHHVQLSVKVAVPYPAQVAAKEVLASIPYHESQIELEIVGGGLQVQGLHLEAMGQGDQIILANAAITVWLDAERGKHESVFTTV